MDTQRWFHQGSDSMITMADVQGGGEGYNVQLHTTLTTVGRDFKRQIYKRSLTDAAHQVRYLMTLVPGTWETEQARRAQEG